MRLIVIFFTGHCLLSFERLVLCDRYELKIVKSIVEVPVHEGVHLDPHGHSHHFEKKEQRQEWCQTASRDVDFRLKRWGTKFRFDDVVEAEELKTYVVESVREEGTKKIGLTIVVASKCLTSPPIYVYLDHIDTKGTGNDREMVFHVIFQHSDPPVNYSDITNFYVDLVDDITEASVDKIKTVSSLNENVVQTLQNTNLPNERERLRLCKGGIQTVPEFKIRWQATASPGENKYYAVKSSQREEDVEYLLQAFDCPTEPKVYVAIRDGDDVGPLLWTMIRSSGNISRPKFNLMGYSVFPVKSIKIDEEPNNKGRDSIHDGESMSVDVLPHEDGKEDRQLNEQVDGSADPILKQSALSRLASEELVRGMSELKIERNASEKDFLTSAELFPEFDIEHLTREELLGICGNALIAALGIDNPTFTVDDRGDLIRNYTIQDARSGHTFEGMRAFECTTKEPPHEIYLDIIDRGDGMNMVVIYIEGKEYVEQLRSQANMEE